MHFYFLYFNFSNLTFFPLSKVLQRRASCFPFFKTANQKGKKMTIHNFHTKETHFLSNFYPYTTKEGEKQEHEVRVIYEGLEFDSTESAYMASKMARPQDRLQFVGMHPKVAKKLTHSGTLEIRADWEDVKVGIMEDLVRQKFNNSPALTRLLLATGTQEIVEGNTWGDTVWGMVQDENGTWQGDNHLGKILMKVRAEIQKQREPRRLIQGKNPAFNPKGKTRGRNED